MSFDKDTIKQFAAVLNIAEGELSKILKLYDKGQKDLEQIIIDLFKKYGSTDGEQFYNELKKYDRLKQLDNQISEVTKEIANTETVLMSSLFAGIATDSYYRNLFVLESNLKSNIKFDLLRKEIIETVVNMPLEGLQFSERLYANQIKLKQNVKAVIIDGITRGQDIRTITKALNERMDIGKYNASRIVRTETSRIWYTGQNKSFETSGVEKVIYISTLDGRTSSICRGRDGNVYDLGKEPSLPAHPNCRSTYGAYYEDSKLTERMDNQTKEFIPYKTYEEWYKDKVSKE